MLTQDYIDLVARNVRIIRQRRAASHAVGPQLPAQQCTVCGTPLVYRDALVYFDRFRALSYACNLLDDDHA